MNITPAFIRVKVLVVTLLHRNVGTTMMLTTREGVWGKQSWSSTHS
jgi:hypothetical protein